MTAAGAGAEHAATDSAAATIAMSNNLEMLIRCLPLARVGDAVCHKNAYRRCWSPQLPEIRQGPHLLVVRNLCAPTGGQAWLTSDVRHAKRTKMPIARTF